MKIQDINKINNTKSKLILIKIIDTKGSVPRNKNVTMVISKNNQYGTIGGGELEYRVTNESIKLLNNSSSIEKIIEFPLGPSLGQCCGGYIKIKLNKYNNGENLLKKNNLKDEILNHNKNLYIFGAGHVAKALMKKLDGTGFNIFVIDSRDEFISKIKIDYINAIFAKEPQIIIKNAPPKSFYLVMTHSHQIDLSICSSLLKINNFSFLGLIGSETKMARFSKRLIQIGYNKKLIDRIECPIGVDGIVGKEPDIIAISIIARLLQCKSLLNNQQNKYLKLVKY